METLRRICGEEVLLTSSACKDSCICPICVDKNTQGDCLPAGLRGWRWEAGGPAYRFSEIGRATLGEFAHIEASRNGLLRNSGQRLRAESLGGWVNFRYTEEYYNASQIADFAKFAGAPPPSP